MASTDNNASTQKPGRTEAIADSCRVTVTHDQMREGASPEIYGGWPMILSGLKTLLETGGTLTPPVH